MSTWGCPIDLIMIWKFMDNNSKGIAKLTICICSIIANSGASKCNFSDFSNIPTKIHNRLSI
jgi:hypothetical protein